MRRQHLNDLLAHNLRYYRNESGLTQAVVAKLAKMSVRQYQKLEAGAANATLESLNSTARPLEVTVDQLLRLSFHRTHLPSDSYLQEFKKAFSPKTIGAGIRDLNGVILWGNDHADKIQGGGLNYARRPLDLFKVLKGPALETLRNQLACEQKGLIAPYINSVSDRETGEKIYLRYYPTLILPQEGHRAYFVSVYISTMADDCQKNYYDYCRTLAALD